MNDKNKQPNQENNLTRRSLGIGAAALAGLGIVSFGLAKNVGQPSVPSTPEVLAVGGVEKGFQADAGTPFYSEPSVATASIYTVPKNEVLDSNVAVTFKNPSTGNIYVGVPGKDGMMYADASSTPINTTVNKGEAVIDANPIKDDHLVEHGNNFDLVTPSGVEPVPEAHTAKG